MLQSSLVHLRYRANPHRFMPELFENFMERSLEDAFDDPLRIAERMRFAIRMQPCQPLTKSIGEQILPTTRPLSKFDESWTGTFHLFDEERVPPDSSPSISFLVFADFSASHSSLLPPTPHKKHGRGEDDGHEKTEEVEESPGCSEGLDDERVNNIADFDEGSDDDVAAMEILVVFRDRWGEALMLWLYLLFCFGLGLQWVSGEIVFDEKGSSETYDGYRADAADLCCGGGAEEAHMVLVRLH